MNAEQTQIWELHVKTRIMLAKAFLAEGWTELAQVQLKLLKQERKRLETQRKVA
jgi:hypothetical protein